MRYRWTRRAKDDLADAAEFYDSQRRGLGSEFCVEVGLAIAAILDAPQRWPEIEPGYPRYRLDHFPYALIYRIVAADLFEITAVFDLRKRPGSWHDRGANAGSNE